MNLEDLYRLLRSAHVQAQGMVDTIPEPMLVLDERLCVETANRAFFESFRVGRDETIGRRLYELGGGQWNIPELRRLLEDVIPKSSAVVGYEVRSDFPSLGPRTMLVSARRLVHPDSNSSQLLLWIEDATNRLHREREKDLLIGEMQHRVKNLLAMVQSLARQTAVEGRSGEQYRDAFLGRFAALSHAHNLAFKETGTTKLDELVAQTLEPYSTDERRILVSPGPHVELRSVQIVPVNLILHELATNAVKHGALSASGGQIRVSWELADEEKRLYLRWQEFGGPQVRMPTAEGFGMRLVEFAAKHELGGQAELTFAPEGLIAEVALPVA